MESAEEDRMSTSSRLIGPLDCNHAATIVERRVEAGAIYFECAACGHLGDIILAPQDPAPSRKVERERVQSRFTKAVASFWRKDQERRYIAYRNKVGVARKGSPERSRFADYWASRRRTPSMEEVEEHRRKVALELSLEMAAKVANATRSA
jgi:hypothetical protein